MLCSAKIVETSFSTRELRTSHLQNGPLGDFLLYVDDSILLGLHNALLGISNITCGGPTSPHLRWRRPTRSRYTICPTPDRARPPPRTQHHPLAGITPLRDLCVREDGDRKVSRLLQ